MTHSFPTRRSADLVTLQPFDDDAQALALANAGDYGLAASIWTRDLNRAHRLAATIHAGIVWINCWLMRDLRTPFRSEEHTSELQSLMRISYAVFCLKKKTQTIKT